MDSLHTDKADFADDYWHVNAGSKKIHAARIKGRFATFKKITGSLWLIFFLLPYMRWHGRQAVMFDISGRKFYLFSATIWPQDIWMLSLVLVLLAISLFAITAIAGRVFCGYFCFQTAWADLFTYIEGKIEGPPQKRIVLDKAPWTLKKALIKLPKHFLWLVISVLTGITFTLYFEDAYSLWHSFLTLDAPPVAWVVVGLFTAGTYILAGFMREQVCFWLCPYARIQGVMYDKDTLLPTYDYVRGEPRGKIRRDENKDKKGDCVDCNLCVAVCPTGVDIRRGQQEGCITCGLCIDACNFMMDKVGKPGGLIRYSSLDEMEGIIQPPLYKRPRVIIYTIILFTAFLGIAYGLTNIKTIDLSVSHERQPLFVMLSDGSIQNKYSLKLVNRMGKDVDVKVTVAGPDGLNMSGVQKNILMKMGKVTPVTAFIKIPSASLKDDITPIFFKVVNSKTDEVYKEYESMFVSPK